MTNCETVFGMEHCVRSEKRRGFQPPWYTVFVLRCPTCGTERHIRQNWQGGVPSFGIKCGAIKL